MRLSDAQISVECLFSVTLLPGGQKLYESLGFTMVSEDPWQGLTLVHFSAQPEPFLTRNTP
jgi:hypothetical protein